MHGPKTRLWLRRTLVALLAAALSVGLAPGAGRAQDTISVPSPLLTLDQERLFNGSRAAELIAEEFKRRTDDLTAENRKIEADLTAEELDLTKRRAELPTDEFRALADAFDQKVQSIRSEQDTKARELQRLQDQERQDFLRRITPVLADIVRERGAVAVLDRRSVLLSADAIDITDEAIARINAAIESGNTDAGATTPDDTAPPETPAPDTAPPTSDQN